MNQVRINGVGKGTCKVSTSPPSPLLTQTESVRINVMECYLPSQIEPARLDSIECYLSSETESPRINAYGVLFTIAN